MNTYRILVGVSLLCMGMISRSSGTVVPAATYSYGWMRDVDVPGTTSEHNSSTYLEDNWVAQVSGGNPPQTDVQVQLNPYTPTPGVVYQRYAGASATYWWAVSPSSGAPAGITTVPVTITLRGDASVSGPGRNIAQAYASAGPLTRVAEATSETVANDSFIYTETIDVDVSTVYMALITSSVQLWQGNNETLYGNAEGQSVADPVITIAADYAYRDYFTVDFSQNLPEPASLGLIAAIACASLLRRCR